MTDQVIPRNDQGELQGAAADWIFNWDFGDGQTASGDLVEHTYNQEGQYQVRLTVTDPNGSGFCQKNHSHDLKSRPG